MLDRVCLDIFEANKNRISISKNFENHEENVTDDPLATINVKNKDKNVFSVNRSVFLPRLSIRNLCTTNEGINPIYVPPREKSSSSGYGDSNTESFEQFVEDYEQNRNFTKKNGAVDGILSTIPEREIPVPIPIWPKSINYDSIVDDALLFYTSFNYKPNEKFHFNTIENYIDFSVNDLLLEILNGINETLEGKNSIGPETMLKEINEQIKSKIELLKSSTEEEVRRLCVNLTKCRMKNCVIRALSQPSTEYTESTDRNSVNFNPKSTNFDRKSIDFEQKSTNFDRKSTDFDQISIDFEQKSNVIRNMIICESGELLMKIEKDENEEKPSVWQQYYGVKAVEEVENGKKNLTDVPLYPRGRPEADFTLDFPRSEHLIKRMKNAKKWRCRCRLLTTFFGFIFFLLSVMAVSLILTRGKRLFGSMV